MADDSCMALPAYQLKITGIIWRQLAPEQIEVLHADGSKEYVGGTYSDAARMADNAGMRRVATPAGSVRWAKDSSPADEHALAVLRAHLRANETATGTEPYDRSEPARRSRLVWRRER